MEGEECEIGENAALLFEGGERLHWVPQLRPPPDGSDVLRTTVFLEHTVMPSREVRWSWPWRKSDRVGRAHLLAVTRLERVGKPLIVGCANNAQGGRDPGSSSLDSVCARHTPTRFL